MMLEATLRRLPEALRREPVAVVMGGPSPEREVSLRSGQRVLQSLRKLGFKASPLEADLSLAQHLVAHKFHLAFLATHGCPGEDGSIQGLLEGMGISYTGAGVAGSVLALNKLAAKALLQPQGMLTPTWSAIDQRQPAENLVGQLGASLGFPLIVKPTYGGSSLGVRLCSDKAELRAALDHLMPEHRDLFAEKYVAGRELTVSVLEDARGVPYALPVLELQPRRLFYDYESKIDEGGIDFVLPAPLTPELDAEVVRLALEAHRRLEQRDFSRSDFILDADNRLQYLETNSIPGLTELSDLPAQALAKGMAFEEVVAGVLLGAWRRHSKN